MKLDELLTNPLWFPAQVNFENLIFEELSPATLKTSPFLDARAIGKTGKTATVPLATLFENEGRIFAAAQPIYEIFHISHVGSTFIARLMDEFPATVVYKEPPILHGLATQYMDAQTGTAFFDRDSLLRLNALIYAFLTTPNKTTIIKHTSQNLILPRALAPFGVTVKPALYLYTNCETFLCHGLSSQGLALDSHNNIRNRIMFLNAVALNEHFEVSALNALQKMAVLWMAEMVKLILRSSAENGDKLVNFDTHLATKGRSEIVAELATHFNLNSDDAEIQKISKSPVWNKNSKNEKSDSFERRQTKIHAAAKQNRADIDATLEWAKSICARNVTLHKLLAFF